MTIDAEESRTPRAVARNLRARCAAIRRSTAGRASASPCRRTRSARRPSSTGSTALARDAGPPHSACAWSRARTGTPRSSARRCWAWPAIRCSRARRTPTSRTSPARARMLDARRRASIRCSRRTTRTRSPGSTAARTRAATTAFEFQRLHGMGEALYAQVIAPRSATARAASTRRSAATRTCCPTSCAACSKTAPTPRSSTASPTPTVSIDDIVADPVANVRARATTRRDPRCRCRGDLFGGERRNSAGVSLADQDAMAALDAALAAAAARDGRRDADARRAARRRGTARDVVDPGRSPRSDRHRRRRRRRHGRSRARRRSSRRSRRGTRAAARRAPTILERAADVHRARRATSSSRCCAREAGKTRADAIAEVREAADFCRYYAREARAPFRRPAGAARRPTGEANTLCAARPRRVRLHPPVEFPAGDLHRPGRRGARRRQRGRREARRADAAHRARAPCELPASRPACPATCSRCCPAPARPSAPRWSRDPRIAGVAFTGSTDVARRDRPHARRARADRRR